MVTDIYNNNFFYESKLVRGVNINYKNALKKKLLEDYGSGNSFNHYSFLKNVTFISFFRNCLG